MSILSVALAFLAAEVNITRAENLPLKLAGHGGPIKSIALSGDGARALTASFDYTAILWDLSNKKGDTIHRLVGHDAAVNDAVFIPHSNRAVTVGDDGSLIIWNLETGQIASRIRNEPVKVLDVNVSPDGNFAADARWDQTARLYDLAKAEQIAVLSGHRGNVNSVAFSKDSKRLYTAAHDGQILEWDVSTATMLRPVYRHGWGINSIGMIDDHRLLFGAINGSVGVVDLADNDTVKLIIERERPVQTVKVSQDGKLLGFGDGVGYIGIFSAEDLQLLEGNEVAYGPVWDFDFIPDTFQVFHVGLDDFAIRWQIAPRKFSQIESKFPRRFQLVESEDPGELEFQRKCSVCHTLTPDGENRAGPTLYNLFGRRVGTVAGYAYSASLKNSDVVWNEETIGRLFDEGPDIMMPGTKMPIQRLKSVARRDDLIGFLKRATTPINGKGITK